MRPVFTPRSPEDCSEEQTGHLGRLIALAHQIVAVFGNPELSRDFDAGQWLEAWLRRPQPSLAMQTPADLLMEAGGMDRVETLLRRVAVDAFA